MTIKKKNRFYEIVAAVGFLLATVRTRSAAACWRRNTRRRSGGAHPGALGVGFSLELVNCMAVVLIGIRFFTIAQCGSRLRWDTYLQNRRSAAALRGRILV